MRTIKLVVAFMIALIPRWGYYREPGVKSWKLFDLDYPQTWDHMPRNERARSVLRSACGWLGSHEESETELSTGGGGVFFSNCRWCGISMRVTKHPAMRRVKWRAQECGLGEKGEAEV